VRLRTRPALVLIAGDSGVGKDTLADGLTSILGRDSTVLVSGDDYHRWDRGDGSWEYLTHLNPLSNELPKFFNDILSLSDGRTIRAGKYDHRIGRRLSSRNARSREFVIGSGLHALMIPDVNRHSSLTVFLEMTEDLRANLKIMRDTQSRGHAPEDVLRSIKARLEDSQKYVQPQRALADLVVKTRVAEGSSNRDFENLEIEFESEPKVFDSQLVSELGMTCGLEVSIANVAGGRRRICARGSATQADLSSAFENLEPRVSDILGGSSGWNQGPAGVVQMVTMVYLANSLKRERLVK
jgi:uridine kinase